MSYVYPLRRKSRSSGLIVEFTGLEEGIVIDVGSRGGVYRIGEYHNGWINHASSSTWEPMEIPQSTKRKLHEAVKNYGRV